MLMGEHLVVPFPGLGTRTLADMVKVDRLEVLEVVGVDCSDPLVQKSRQFLLNYCRILPWNFFSL